MTEKEFEEAVKRISNGEGGASDKDKLLLYGYYKQATVGPCHDKKPGMFSFVAKAKWEAWHALGDMDKETAMKKYIEEAERIVPKPKDGEPQNQPPKAKKNESWVVFSRPVMEDDANSDAKEEEPDKFEKLWSCIDSDDNDGALTIIRSAINSGNGVPRHPNGYYPLHYAAEHGKCDFIKVLLSAENADLKMDINARDSDGNTPLHVACCMEDWNVARALIAAGADRTAKDADGLPPELPEDI